jgi:hypothetical protein
MEITLFPRTSTALSLQKIRDTQRMLNWRPLASTISPSDAI